MRRSFHQTHARLPGAVTPAAILYLGVAVSCVIGLARGVLGADRPGGEAAAVDMQVLSAAAAPAAQGIFSQQLDHGSAMILNYDHAAALAAVRRGRPILIRKFPLEGGLFVDLSLEPFSVTGPHTRFVIGRIGQPDKPLSFDPAAIALFRGHVAGRAGSYVVLALCRGRSTGSIDLGSGDRRFFIAPGPPHSGEGGGADSNIDGPQALQVFEAESASGARGELPPHVALCGVADAGLDDMLIARPGDRAPLPQAGRLHPKQSPAVAGDPLAGPKQIELAVETDFEFYSLFGDTDAAATYLVQLYAQVSAIYLRDVGARVELVFARLWDNPDDLFNNVDPSPLPEFRAYWNDNMQSVHRDVAQLLSGRRDYPFGGQAYLSALCTAGAYSVVGYALGFFPDPSRPSPLNYDIEVTAHELGHNAGTGHTHDPPNFIDTCNNPATTPQRGTIMSYCSQTWSGGNANTDLYFHTVIHQNIETFLATATCIANDCNGNSTDDAAEILLGTATDSNGNNIPDACEDCNGNGVLDDAEIARGSADFNGNGIPDACEPDCNGNGIPDDADIAGGGSGDAYGNGVPDECEFDCNGNSVSDFTEIQLDMPLDVDRNAVLDACQDCDGDGTSDLEALAGAHSLWLASGLAGSRLSRFYSTTGVLTGRSSDVPAALVQEGQDVIISPGGQVWVSSAGDDRVLAFALDGSYIGNIVAPGAGGLDAPAGLAVHPDGALLVASRGTHSVLAYDLQDGTPFGAFVAAGSGGLVSPFGLTFGPGGDLFVTSDDGRVLRYRSKDGTFVGAFVSVAGNGGLDQPRGLVFKPDGNLLVASFGTNEVLEYDGVTGAPLGQWAHVGTATVLTQISPWGIRVGPNGNVFVVRTGESFGSGGGNHGPDHLDANTDILTVHLHFSNAQIYEFDVRNGNFIRVHVGGNDHGHLFPTGFAFIPGWQVDCNMNALPDACDVSSGRSADADGDGVPDECEIDCNANGRLDRLDIIPYGASFDCNYNLSPDECDIASGTSADANGDGIPDECCVTLPYGDIDASGVVDLLDIFCVLGGFLRSAACPAADIAPCGGDGAIDLSDILAVLDAFRGVGNCPDPCQR